MQSPARILFTIPNFITAGSGRAMLNIAERLDPTRFAPAVCVQKMGGDLDKVVQDLGIPFFEAPTAIPARPYHTLPLRVRASAKCLEGKKFSLWHSFHYSDDYTEPLIAYYSGAKKWIFTKKNMSWGSNAWTLRSLFAGQILAQNRVMVDEFFQKPLLINKVTLVERGVVTDKFKPLPQSYELRRSLGIPDRAVVAACVAHLIPRKDHPTILRALPPNPELHILLAGKTLDADYVQGLHTLAEELGIEDRVHFLGLVSDIPRLLSEADISVLASKAEGSPVALLEVMACEKACIVSDIGGCRDIAGDDSALVFSVRDHCALADHFKRLVQQQDFRLQLGTKGRQRVVDKYSIEREVRQHEEVYARALGF